MRTIHCTKCGHKDEIEDRRPMFEQPLEVLPVHELRELSGSIARGDLAGAACALDMLFGGEPELREVIEQARFSAKRAA